MVVQRIATEKPTDAVVVAAPYAPAGPVVAATSNTSASPQIGGTYSFKVNETGLGFMPGFRVRVAAQDAPTAWIEGIVTDFDGVNLTLESDLFNGFGTWAAWNINVTGEPGLEGPEGPQGPVGPPGPSGAGGVSSIAVQDGLSRSAGTGDVTIGIQNNGIANGKLATMSAHTYKGNNGGASGSPIDLTISQVMTDLGAAPLASPGFSGTPTAPTAANGTNNTQLATCAYVLATRLDQFAPPNIDVTWNNHRVIGLLDPASAQDAATKNYVDAVIQGLQIKPTARLATAATLPGNTYSNGTAGLGATLTATANAALSIDGVAVAANDIVLVKNEAAAANNGLYRVTTAGSGSAAYVLTRHVDMDTAGEYAGAFVPVGAGGTTNANTLWLANPSTPVTPGTSAIPFTQLNAATSYTAGNGINIAGNIISAVGTANRIAIAAGGIDISVSYAGQASITTLGTIAAGTWQGSTIAVSYGGTGATTLTGYVKGAGTVPLTASPTIPSADVTGLGTMAAQNASNVTITGGSITLTGTMTLAADPTTALQAATKQYVDANISGGAGGAYTSISTAGTTNLDNTYNGNTIGVDCSAGNITLTITAAATLPIGWFVRLVRLDASANTITVDPNASETIDGRLSGRLITQYDQCTIRDIGSAFITEDARWSKRILRYVTSGATTFTIANEVPLGCPNYELEGWSAGGSGAGSSTTVRGAGAASGCYGRKAIPTALDTSLTFNIGAGAAGVAGGTGSSMVAGNTGGPTTIVGTNLGTLTLPGGGGGLASGAGGIPGTPSGAWDEFLTGSYGDVSPNSAVSAGMGGSAPRGGQGGRNNVSSPGLVPGGAGSCSNHLSSTSGAGANGGVTVTI